MQGVVFHRAHPFRSALEEINNGNRAISYMATKRSTIDYIEDQLAEVPEIRSQKMFGEYALYCGDKVVALVCDETVFVKITEEGRTFVGDRYEEGHAYPGAKPSMRIDEDLVEDHEWFSELIRITERNLPKPKPKKSHARVSKAGGGSTPI